MKATILAVVLGTLTLAASAQLPALAITTTKTISLVFPAVVRHVDRGSRAILVQQVPGAGHVLLVRAAQKEFEPTNLSVVTEDGVVYSLGVVYDPAPARWIYTLRHEREESPGEYARALADHPRTLHGVSDRMGGIRGTLKGLYIRGSVFYFLLELENTSALDFDAELLHFYLRDRKAGKRMPVQETELTPLVVTQVKPGVPANGKRCVVAALSRFTLSPSRYLAIELVEKGEGRHLQLKVSMNRLLKAIPLPEHP